MIGIYSSFIIFILMLLLHLFSCSNLFINISYLVKTFFPFIFKGLFSCFITFTLMISVFLFFYAYILVYSDNQIIANPLITPNNILPE